LDPTDRTNPNRTERRKEETRRKIVDAAVRLFKTEDFATVTMEQIAREADVAKGTLYNHFPVKEAVLADYMRISFQANNAAWIERLKELPDTSARLTFIYTQLIEGVICRPEIFEKFLVYRVQSILSLEKPEDDRSGIEQLSAVIVRLGQESGEIRRDLPDVVLEDLYEFVFIEIAKEYFGNRAAFQSEPTVTRAVSLFLGGAAAPSTHP
jgi:AcrR family transcriptional regulator